MNGAQIIVSFLESKGVNPAFGYPGGPILVLYDALYQANFPHILTRHEQGAVHAAEGYAKVTGKPGVVIATSGPGATNLVTGIADAFLDSVPLLAITGAVARSCTGKDAFQEADITGITQPITKYNYLVMRPEDLLPTLEEAWNLTTEGRPGPVLVNVPKDIMTMEIATTNIEGRGFIRNRPPRQTTDTQLPQVLAALNTSQKPLLLIGGGVVISEGADKLMQTFVEKSGIPVASTMMAKGAISDCHPQYLGMVGMHGTPQANSAIGNCDLLLAVGCRFSDRLIGDPDKYNSRQDRVVIHVDIDPAEIGKNIRPTIEIEDDAKDFFAAILAAMPKSGLQTDWQEWITRLSHKSSRYQELNRQMYVLNDKLLPQAVVYEIAQAYKDMNPIVVTDVGQHQMFATQHFDLHTSRAFLTSGGLGTMGFGLPAAMGAAIAAPNRPVILFVGDGGIQMTMQEYSPIQELGLNLKIVVMDNQQLGMVRQWQELFYERRYSHSLLQGNPNFIQIADAYGIKGRRATNAEEFRLGIEEMLAKDEPYVFHVLLDVEELVYPMIPPGKNPEDMIMPGM